MIHNAKLLSRKIDILPPTHAYSVRVLISPPSNWHWILKNLTNLKGYLNVFICVINEIKHPFLCISVIISLLSHLSFPYSGVCTF